MENVIFIATVTALSISTVLAVFNWTLIIYDFIEDRKNKKRTKRNKELN